MRIFSDNSIIKNNLYERAVSQACKTAINLVALLWWLRRS